MPVANTNPVINFVHCIEHDHGPLKLAWDVNTKEMFATCEQCRLIWPLSEVMQEMGLQYTDDKP